MTGNGRCAVLFLGAAVLAALPASPIGQSASGAEKNRPGQQAAVAKTVERLFRAAEQKRIDEVEGLYSYGPEFSKFDEFGLGREDAAQTRAAEREELASVMSFRASVQGLKVDLFGKVAVATFVLDYTAKTGPGMAAARLRSTVVLRNLRGQWRIVHEHYSPLREQQ